MADPNLIELTTDIVSSYILQNTIGTEELAPLINAIYAALAGLTSSAAATPIEPPRIAPAVTIKKSITPDFLISLEDGRQYKSLKRHLRTAYNMTPEEYRTKWGLPKDYPMVSPNYAANRSAMAKSMGLGRGGNSRNAAATKARTKREPTAKA